MSFTVRLTNGPTKYEGAVEVYHNGEWGAVCDNGWDINDAHVVCNQLYLGEAMNAIRGAFYGQSSGKIWLDDLNCTGTEKSIKQCPHNGWGTQNCSHSKTAGVKCTTGMLYIYIQCRTHRHAYIVLKIGPIEVTLSHNYKPSYLA